jgi:hypothetical protein
MKGSKISFPVVLKYEGHFSEKWKSKFSEDDLNNMRWFVLMAMKERMCVLIWDNENEMCPILKRMKEEKDRFPFVNKKMAVKPDCLVFGNLMHTCQILSGVEKGIDSHSKFSFFNNLTGKMTSLKDDAESVKKSSPPTSDSPPYFNLLNILAPNLIDKCPEIAQTKFVELAFEKVKKSIQEIFFDDEIVLGARCITERSNTEGRGVKRDLIDNADDKTGDDNKGDLSSRAIIMRNAYVSASFVPNCNVCKDYVSRYGEDPLFCEVCMHSVQKRVMLKTLPQQRNTVIDQVVKRSGKVTVELVVRALQESTNYEKLSFEDKLRMVDEMIEDAGDLFCL